MNQFVYNQQQFINNSNFNLQYSESKQNHKQETQLSIHIFRRFINFSMIFSLLIILWIIVVTLFWQTFMKQINKNQVLESHSIMYFLAFLIEINKINSQIKLKDTLQKQQKRLLQNYIEKYDRVSTRSIIIDSKLIKYDDLKYFSLYSLLKLYKSSHEKTAEQFIVTKYMHLVFTLFFLGPMTLKESYNSQISQIQLLTLGVFLLCIYIHTFEIDLYLIQTSNGKLNHTNYNNLTSLSDFDRKIIKVNFLKWRRFYLVFQVIGIVLLATGFFMSNKVTALSITQVLISLLNIIGLYLENSIEEQVDDTIKNIDRAQINPYFILNKSTTSFRTFFKIVATSQRIGLLFIWLVFSWDQSMNNKEYLVVGKIYVRKGLGILLLLLSQKVKFSYGDRVKLLTFQEISYDEFGIANAQKWDSSQCSICLKIFEKGQKITMLPCSKQHKFHRQCFSDWRKIKLQCPLCRYNLSQYN